MTQAAWTNALSAMPGYEAYFSDLARSVTNDDCPDGAARWALSFCCQYLEKRGLAHGPWQAFDLFIYDMEALCRVWPAFRFSYEAMPIRDERALPDLARFLFERLPNIWSGPCLRPVAPVTKAVAIADRIDTLTGLFLAGNKPNGSKDPFALRRAAKELLQMIVFPVTAPLGRAA